MNAYQRPGDVYRTAEGTLILLPYGRVTDWCKNVLAAGQCTVTVDGESLALSPPVLGQASVAEARVPASAAVAQARTRHFPIFQFSHESTPLANECASWTFLKR
jgi:hypothetical protein